ncbi:hypothetical protein SteCoe_28655 [Stentor coeruleus]|uniref:Guanylate cyclase domain-containing protein n=1 Tax=Stentor coeruleus TaxID=5963 RepID=A0A1R2B7R5_9CILI|nr:hypothetical protein SteCoe_28655 [Stentor coeruleus]
MHKTIDSWFFMVLMTLFTIFALFGEDVRVSAFKKEADDGFNIVTTICMFFFTLDLVCSSICKKGYFLSFFFWMDFFSTISLISDISWLWIKISDSGNSSSNRSQVSNAGRASEVSSIAQKTIKFIKVVRLIKIVNLYRVITGIKKKEVQNDGLVRGITNFRAESLKNLPSSIIFDRNYKAEDSVNASISVSFSESGFEDCFTLPNLPENNQLPEKLIEEIDVEDIDIQILETKTEDHEESQVGKELSELTIIRVFTLVIVVILGIQIFMNTLYIDDNTSYEYGLEVMDKLTIDYSQFRRAWNSYINRHSNLKNPLVYLEVVNMGIWHSSTDISTLRENEKIYIVLNGVDSSYEFYSVAIFDARYSMKLASQLNICKTVFICLVLGVFSYVLDRDSKELVINPIENMIKKVKKISKNPLEAAQEQEKKEVMEETARLAKIKEFEENSVVSQIKDYKNKIQKALHKSIEKRNSQTYRNTSKDSNRIYEDSKERKISKNKYKKSKNIIIDQIVNKDQKIKHESEEPMETVFLERTLNKIGALLALGFGEAGSTIIATNMQKGGGEVDPMIPGKRTHCIFGFCDIRDFADATEVLQQEVLSYVNEVAYIVHKTVDYFSGSANKNIGDAFLLVWKFPDNLLQISEDSKNYVLAKDQFVHQLADMSVISFLKIIAEIHKNPKILKYKNHPGLNSRLRGFSVKMGFGLHQGWAIEGAIGSEFKIDASYLSPNVNLASRLEAATKQFGVHILISNVLYNICSHVTKTKLRRVDRVTVKGSKHPMELYTCDIFPNLLKPLDDNADKEDIKKARVMGRIARKKLRRKAMRGEINIRDMWNEDEDLIVMRSGVSKTFIKEFNIALEDYLDGKWVEAKAGFLKAQDLKGVQDGPCQVLIDFINSEGGEAPARWPGYRELHDK